MYVIYIHNKKVITGIHSFLFSLQLEKEKNRINSKNCLHELK